MVIGIPVRSVEPPERARAYSAKTAALIDDLGTVTYLGEAGGALLFQDADHREFVEALSVDDALGPVWLLRMSREDGE